jgi:hypothetical protein
MRSYITIKSALTTILFIVPTALVLHCTAATYTLVDAKGQPTTTNARCATAADSGLTWELKTDDNGVHDKDNTYRWGGIGARQTGAEQLGTEKTGKIFFDDWNELLNASNSEKLCGFDDWRVPTIDELKTLVSSNGQQSQGQPLQKQQLQIDTAIFPHTLATPYWSVSTYQYYPEHAQTVDFATGASNYYNGFRGDRLPVRLVRSD